MSEIDLRNQSVPINKMSKNLTIKGTKCEARFSTIDFCCGSVRVEGWISAPSKDEGFSFCGQVAKAMGREYIGGFCMDDEGPVSFPFSYDVDPQFLFFRKHLRRETLEEAKERVIKTIRKAKKSVLQAEVGQ